MPNNSDHQITSDHIAKHVEALTRGCMDAVNRRDLDITSPAWSCIAEDFVVNSTNFVGHVHGNTGLRQHLDSVANTVANYPDYKMYISEMHTEVSTHQKDAIVFANLESHGNPPGVVLKGVIIYRFSEIGGRWICTRMESAKGI